MQGPHAWDTEPSGLTVSGLWAWFSGQCGLSPGRDKATVITTRLPCCFAEPDTQTEQRNFMVSSPLTSVYCLELQGGSGRRLATLWDVSYIIVVSGDEDSMPGNRMLYVSMIASLTNSRRDASGHRSSSSSSSSSL